MKKLLVFGLLALCVTACSDEKPKMVGETSPMTGTKTVPCDCQCTRIEITSAAYLDFSLFVHVAYATDPDCEIRITVAYQPVYTDMREAPWTFLGDSTVTGDGTTLISGIPTHGEEIVGWNLQAYPVRKCDGLILGWSAEYYIAMPKG